jgi:hypothetical protein
MATNIIQCLKSQKSTVGSDMSHCVAISAIEASAVSVYVEKLGAPRLAFETQPAPEDVTVFRATIARLIAAGVGGFISDDEARALSRVMQVAHADYVFGAGSDEAWSMFDFEIRVADRHDEDSPIASACVEVLP